MQGCSQRRENIRKMNALHPLLEAMPGTTRGTYGSATQASAKANTVVVSCPPTSTAFCLPFALRLWRGVAVPAERLGDPGGRTLRPAPCLAPPDRPFVPAIEIRGLKARARFGRRSVEVRRRALTAPAPTSSHLSRRPRLRALTAPAPLGRRPSRRAAGARCAQLQI